MARFPVYPCRHDPPCSDEATHWEVSGLNWDDDRFFSMSDPLCRDCGMPGDSCRCNELQPTDERCDLVRNEIVVTQKDGYRVVQVSAETVALLDRAIATHNPHTAALVCLALKDDMDSTA